MILTRAQRGLSSPRMGLLFIKFARLFLFCFSLHFFIIFIIGQVLDSSIIYLFNLTWFWLVVWYLAISLGVRWIFFSEWGIFLLTYLSYLYIFTGMGAKRKGDVALFQVRDFPVKLRRSFKGACSVEGVTMKEKLIELVGKYVERQEKRKK